MTSDLTWQLWRWTGYLAAKARGGPAFLPRSITARADLVGHIADRGSLFEQSGISKLRWLAGRIVAGDWDLEATPVREYSAYSSFYERYFEGIPWERTAYWKQVVRDVRQRVPRIGCRSLLEVEQKFEIFDQLWESICTSDYRKGRGGLRYRPWEEVLTALSRKGHLVLVDGRHRLIMAQLKQCSLPMYVILRHG